MTVTSAARLADQLAQAIFEGEFAPGSHLDEAGLAARFGVSRTPVREALGDLVARGLARRRPSRGVEVTAPDRATLIARFEALAEIEALCAGLAAARAGLEAQIALEDLLLAMEEADSEGYRQLNWELHERIGIMAGNPELSRIADGLRQQLRAFRHVQLGDPLRHRQSRLEHRALVSAVVSRRSEEAAQLMRDHLRAAAREVLQRVPCADAATGGHAKGA